MLSIVKSMSLHGTNGYLIDVEVDVGPGLPCWEVVGLPDISVKESKERVKTAIKNSNIDLKSRRIVVNLAPADTKKEGSFFDLPIAVGILIAIGEIPNVNLSDTVIIGELSLDGKINKVNGILPMCIEASNLGIKRVILPKENSKEAAIVKKLDIIGVGTLNEVIEYINGKIELEKEEVNIEEFFKTNSNYNVDFSEVKGQENIKRALEVAASGGHNVLLIGSPGSRQDAYGKKNSYNSS